VASNNESLRELAEQVNGLNRSMSALSGVVEDVLDAQLRRAGKSLAQVRAEQAGRGMALFALPVAHHEQPAETDRTTQLRRQLAEAEAEVDPADSAFDHEQARRRVASLRRELDYSAFERPSTNVRVLGVAIERPNERQFAEPVADFADREDVQRRIDRERRRG
jgi:hypothetical protein